MTRRGLSATVALAAVLLLGACGTSGGDRAGTDRNLATDDQPMGSDPTGASSDGVPAGQDDCDATAERRTDVPTISKGNIVGPTVSTRDVIEAPKDACLADPTQYLTVDFVAATAPGGDVVADTWKADRPYTLRLSSGQLIPGLDTALDGMPVGARRQVFVPSELAYGSDGSEALGIGPDTDLALVVDLLSVSDAPRFCTPVQGLPKGVVPGKPETVETPRVAPTGGRAKATVLEPGAGPKAARDSYVTVDYVGVSCATGQQFDSSWDNGAPITVALPGATPTETAFQVIDGWNQGLVGQSQGSLVQIDIPSDAAYGDQGQPPAIGPKDPLTFVVRILKVSDAPPTS